MRKIIIELPEDALVGTISIVSGDILGLNLKSLNFDCQCNNETVIKFESKENVAKISSNT